MTSQVTYFTWIIQFHHLLSDRRNFEGNIIVAHLVSQSFTSLQCVASRKKKSSAHPPMHCRESPRGFDWTETLTQAMWETWDKSCFSGETQIKCFIEYKEKGLARRQSGATSLHEIIITHPSRSEQETEGSPKTLCKLKRGCWQWRVLQIRHKSSLKLNLSDRMLNALGKQPGLHHR